LPVEELCLLEKRKKGRKRNGGRLTLSSVVENEASDFSPHSGHPSPSITVLEIIPSNIFFRRRMIGLHKMSFENKLCVSWMPKMNFFLL
jgi:hypothetical protein